MACILYCLDIRAADSALMRLAVAILERCVGRQWRDTDPDRFLCKSAHVDSIFLIDVDAAFRFCLFM